MTLRYFWVFVDIHLAVSLGEVRRPCLVHSLHLAHAALADPANLLVEIVWTSPGKISGMGKGGKKEKGGKGTHDVQVIRHLSTVYEHAADPKLTTLPHSALTYTTTRTMRNPSSLLAKL